MINQIIIKPQTQIIAELIHKVLLNLILRYPHPKLNQYLKTYLKKKSLLKLKQNLSNFSLYKNGFIILINQFNSWRKSFSDMVFRYPNLKTINIEKFLLKFQNNVNIKLEQLEMGVQITKIYQDVQKSYNLQVNKGRIQYKWDKLFIQQWRVRKKMYINEIIKNKTSQQHIQKSLFDEKYFQLTKKKYDKLKQNIIEIQLQQKIDNKDTINNGKSSTSKIQKILDIQYSDQQSRFTLNLNTNQTICKRFPRVETIRNYLIDRSDILISTKNYTQIAELISYYLQIFMKNIIQKIVKYAQLHNSNQFQYFSQQKMFIKQSTTLKVVKGSQIKKIIYKDKMKIYQQLIEKQNIYQNKLQSQLEILQQSLITIYPKMNLREQTKESKRGQKLQIKNSHISIALQENYWFNDGISAFMTYHY